MMPTQDCSPKGHLFIFSAPSGGGKTMLVQRLLAKVQGLAASVSTTTRPPRTQEKHGVDYFFVSDAEFDRMVKRGEFLEHAVVFGNRYGTQRRLVQEHLDKGIDVLFDIDWQGANSIKCAFPTSVSFFIIPPTETELRRRLILRGQDSGDVIEQRMAEAKSEMSHYNEFDHVIVNDDPDDAFEAICKVIEGVRTGRSYQLKDHSELIASMLEVS